MWELNVSVSLELLSRWLMYLYFVVSPSPGFSTWWLCSSCLGCVSMQRGVELRLGASVQVWAAIQKRLCANPEEAPQSTTGTRCNDRMLLYLCLWLCCIFFCMVLMFSLLTVCPYTSFLSFFLFLCVQSWSRSWGEIWLQNHPEHRLLQHRLLCEGATRHALLEHDRAVVAASLHLPQCSLQSLHPQVSSVCAAACVHFTAWISALLQKPLCNT